MALNNLLFSCLIVIGALIGAVTIPHAAPLEISATHRGATDAPAPCGIGPATNAGCAPIRQRRILNATDAPWRAIGRVNFASIKIRSHCTGVLIAKDWVLTAAHCLFNQHRKSWIPAKSLRFTAGYERGIAVATSAVDRYILDPVFDLQGNTFLSRPQIDWALLHLTDPIGDETGWADLLSPDEQTVSDAQRVVLPGYAALRPHVLTLAEDCGAIAYKASLILARCAVMKGDSGAPLVFQDGGRLKVLGVLSSSAQNGHDQRNLIVPASTIPWPQPTSPDAPIE